MIKCGLCQQVNINLTKVHNGRIESLVQMILKLKGFENFGEVKKSLSVCEKCSQGLEHLATFWETIPNAKTNNAINAEHCDEFEEQKPVFLKRGLPETILIDQQKYEYQTPQHPTVEASLKPLTLRIKLPRRRKNLDENARALEEPLEKRVRRLPKRYEDFSTNSNHKKEIHNLNYLSLKKYPEMVILRSTDGQDIAKLVEVEKDGVSSRMRIICEICCKVFHIEKDFKTHMQIHNTNQLLENYLFYCKLCNKSFPEHYPARLHFRQAHATERAFKCQHCEESFKYKFNLDYHMAKHVPKKCFKCDFCGKLFLMRYELQNHLRIHTKEKPYKCEFCSIAFSHRSNLKVHQKKQHFTKTAAETTLQDTTNTEENATCKKKIKVNNFKPAEILMEKETDKQTYLNDKTETEFPPTLNGKVNGSLNYSNATNIHETSNFNENVDKTETEFSPTLEDIANNLGNDSNATYISETLNFNENIDKTETEFLPTSKDITNNLGNDSNATNISETLNYNENIGKSETEFSPTLEDIANNLRNVCNATNFPEALNYIENIGKTETVFPPTLNGKVNSSLNYSNATNIHETSNFNENVDKTETEFSPTLEDIANNLGNDSNATYISETLNFNENIDKTETEFLPTSKDITNNLGNDSNATNISETLNYNENIGKTETEFLPTLENIANNLGNDSNATNFPEALNYNENIGKTETVFPPTLNGKVNSSLNYSNATNIHETSNFNENVDKTETEFSPTLEDIANNLGNDSNATYISETLNFNENIDKTETEFLPTSKDITNNLGNDSNATNISETLNYNENIGKTETEFSPTLENIANNLGKDCNATNFAKMLNNNENINETESNPINKSLELVEANKTCWTSFEEQPNFLTFQLDTSILNVLPSTTLLGLKKWPKSYQTTSFTNLQQPENSTFLNIENSTTNEIEETTGNNNENQNYYTLNDLATESAKLCLELENSLENTADSLKSLIKYNTSQTSCKENSILNSTQIINNSSYNILNSPKPDEVPNLKISNFQDSSKSYKTINLSKSSNSLGISQNKIQTTKRHFDVKTGNKPWNLVRLSKSPEKIKNILNLNTSSSTNSSPSRKNVSEKTTNDFLKLCKEFLAVSEEKNLDYETTTQASCSKSISSSKRSLLKPVLQSQQISTLSVTNPSINQNNLPEKPLITKMEILPPVKLTEILQNSSATTNLIKSPIGHKYQCPYCYIYFKLKSPFTKHMRTHTGEKPYKCNLCPKSYADASNYKKHKILHKNAAEALNISQSSTTSTNAIGNSPAHSTVSDPDPDGVEVMQTIKQFQCTSTEDEDDDAASVTSSTMESQMWQNALEHCLMNEEIRENIKRNLQEFSNNILPKIMSASDSNLSTADPD